MPKDPEREPRGGAPEARPSWGNMSDAHWSRARADANPEAMEYLRARSRAPGVAEGGAARNHYCMSCNGVIPLDYDSRRPSEGPPGACPHCGAELEEHVRAMFNWVEIDQVPRGDARAVLPLALGALALLLLLVAGLLWVLG